MAQFLFQVLYSFMIVTIVLGNSLGELQKSYADLVMECAKEFPLTPEDIAQLQNKQLPEKEPVKCLFACTYKKAGMMDDEGKMSLDGAQDVIHKYLADDPDTMKKALDFINACSIVNEAEVSDGTKGCDRAALMFRCSIDKADESLNDAEVKAAFTKTVLQCTKEFPVDMKELLQLQALKVPKKQQTKCLLACAYKKIKTFNDKGMYVLDEGYKFAELSKNGDEQRLINGRKLAEMCSMVNDMEVTDGDKGCDRAAFFFKCFTENGQKLGFKM
ncbi:uncharacterized protein LOC106719797 [Papilio machaon]|uniref:uncharacterized protein LOC106719797 n=1 Tax=Papilio machaon TaxID=76193 RepID=UPI001E663222|nr:uncharacterized protein LOC106719797 [Papilio machaon]